MLIKSNISRQDGAEPTVPVAPTRIVFGRRHSFIYIENCPLCGLEHMHGRYELSGPYSDPLQAYQDGGLRASHCFAHGVGHMAKRIRGEWCFVPKPAPPEWHAPQGESYRLILGPKPACFTPLGIKTRLAR